MATIEWIRVEENLPPSYENHLVLYWAPKYGMVHVGWHNGVTWYNDVGKVKVPVTHWAEYPSPPSEEER